MSKYLNETFNHKNTKTTPQKLTSEQDKTAKLRQYYGDGFRNRGRLFLPSDEFYNKVSSSESIHEAASEIFKWLGLKHRSVVIATGELDTAVSYTNNGTTHKITISDTILTQPYLAASVLVHAIMHFMLIGRKKIILDPSADNEYLTDMAAIESGLGIIILNGHEKTGGILRRQQPAPCLGGMSKKQFARYFRQWVKTHGLNPYKFSGHILPGIRTYTGIPLSKGPKPAYVKKAIKRSAYSSLAFITSIFILLVLGGAVAYMWAIRPPQLPQSMIDLQNTIDTARQQYENCTATLNMKSETLDKNSIEEAKNLRNLQKECEANRTRYNSLVEEYNNKVKEL